MQLRESRKYKRGRQKPKISFWSQICPSKPVGGEEESKERREEEEEGGRGEEKGQTKVCCCLEIMGNWIPRALVWRLVALLV